MHTMTFEEYTALLPDPRDKKLFRRVMRKLAKKPQRGSEYYFGRWEYFKETIELVHKVNPSSVLEIGPGKHTIVHNCDIMIKKEGNCWGMPVNKTGKVFFRDATRKPWPIADKSYDVVIALQVWEHLDNKQTRAFREVMRVAKNAILSFPYLWDCPKDNTNYPSHHQIDEELIQDWTCNIPPKERIFIPRTDPDELSRGARIIYFWEF